MKGPLRLVVVLFLVCGIAAGSLAFVNAATKDRIAEFARLEKIEAMQKVLPDAQEFAEVQAGNVWEARIGDQVVGRVLAVSTQGYSGPIEGLIGLYPAGVISGVRVLVQTETPGLGAKIATAGFLDQFQGKKPGEVALKKDDPAGRIDAITAATISSRAITAAVRKAIESYQKGEAQ
jgi:electron transport complex protein RnfG